MIICYSIVTVTGKKHMSLESSINKIALENDILEILIRNREMRSNQIRESLIQNSNYKNKCKSKYTLSRTLDVYISRILKKLANNGDVKRRIDRQTGTKWYSLTNQGRKNAPFQTAYNKIRDSVKIPPQKTLELLIPEILYPSIDSRAQSYSDKQTVMTLEEITPKGKAPVDIALWINPANKDKIEAISNSFKEGVFLENTAWRFVENAKKAIIDATPDLYRWYGFGGGQPEIRKLIETLRASLDFDIILMLQFNGRKFVEIYDWDKVIRKYKERDMKEQQRKETFLPRANSPSKLRETWIEWEVLEALSNHNYNMNRYILHKELIRPSTSSLIDNFAEYIVGMAEVSHELYKNPNPPRVEDVKENLKEMLEDGTIKIAHTFVLNKEKYKEKARKAVLTIYEETGYELDWATTSAERANKMMRENSEKG
jgi:DNA-binding HxlR family transcriptional regulator